jgi:acyl-CoA reductase-like NAD-dependent aldehyde dehydrogenase
MSSRWNAEGTTMTTLQLISPVDGRVYAERTALTPEAADAAVARARAAQGAWAARPLDERRRLVLAGIAALNDMKAPIVEELAWQMGRPTRFGGEFGGLNERAHYMAGIAETALAPMVAQDDPRFLRQIERAPVGVVFVIAPWNYPYLTAFNTIVPALIAGNSVILKHASQTLLVGERMAEALHQGGVPPDVFQNIVLDHAGTERLIAARSFGFVNFTGSVAGGQAIERAAAGTFTPLPANAAAGSSGFTSMPAATMTLSTRRRPGRTGCGLGTRSRRTRHWARWPMSALPGPSANISRMPRRRGPQA